MSGGLEAFNRNYDTEVIARGIFVLSGIHGPCKTPTKVHGLYRKFMRTLIKTGMKQGHLQTRETTYCNNPILFYIKVEYVITKR